MKRSASTRQLIADAEALVAGRKPVLMPASTPQLVADVEALLARQRPRRRLSPLTWLAGVALAAGAASAWLR